MENCMDFIQKLIALEKSIAAEKGDFSLFAIAKRAEGIGLWDVIVSAPWAGKKEKEVIDFIFSKMKEILTPDDLMLISRIEVFAPDNPSVRQIYQLIKEPVKHGNVELSSWTLSNIPVSHAHIITAAAPSTPQSASVSFSQSTPPAGETSSRHISQ